MKKLWLILAALILAAGAGAFFYTKGPRGVPLRVIFTSSTAGLILPVEKEGYRLGGIERRATLIEQMRTPYSIVVDTGDFSLPGSPRTSAYRAAVSLCVLKAMEVTGVEVCNIGLEDQKMGKKALLELAGEVKVPLVSASVVDAETNEYVLEPFVVIERNNLKVAFVGLIDDALLFELKMMKAEALKNAVDPSAYSRISGMVEEGEGLSVLGLQQALVRVTPLVKGRADIVIILFAGNEPIWQALGPYAHEWTYEAALAATKVPPNVAEMQGEVAVLRNGDAGTHVGVANFHYRGPRKSALTGWAASAIEMDLEPDPAVTAVITQMRESLKDIEALLIVDKVKGPARKTYAGSEACAECHGEEYEVFKGSRHYKSFESLRQGHAQYDPDCLRCHVTDIQSEDGYMDEKTTPERAMVSCESCHDRSSGHVEAARAGREPLPKVFLPGPPICVRCHDKVNSPDFYYPTYWARIRHGEGRRPEPAQGAARAEGAAGAEPEEQ